jgi:hypothetical protein
MSRRDPELACGCDRHGEFGRFEVEETIMETVVCELIRHREVEQRGTCIGELVK